MKSRESLREYCDRTGREHIVSEWLQEKNGQFTPDNISFGSNKKMWWRCSEGHEWQAAVKARSADDSCPVCKNKIVKKGTNDLASTHPQLAAEWHPTKNYPTTASDVFAGTRKEYWWKCEKGHEWKAEVASRSNGKGCPYCSGKKVEAGFNDLGTIFPQIAEQWDADKNYPLTPADVTPFSNKKVWWKCSSGYSWEAVIASRTLYSSTCPYCSGRKVLKGFNDLVTKDPIVAKEWHPELNGNLSPDMVTSGSHKKVWWQCTDGHEWRAMVFSRTGAQRCGCPVCAGNYKHAHR